MDSTKELVGSDAENDQQPEKVDEDDDSIGTGRSYECAFCKRGFTNAQALGGHMNIHRKDKAKAKQLITQQPSSSPSTNKSSELDHPKYFSPISGTAEQEHYYYSTLGGQMNYQSYFPASTNPSFPHAYRPNFEFPSMREDGGGGNLRLGIGLPHMEEGEEKNEEEEKRSRKGNEVDLELRLGHSP